MCRVILQTFQQACPVSLKPADNCGSFVNTDTAALTECKAGLLLCIGQAEREHCLSNEKWIIAITLQQASREGVCVKS